MICVKFEIQFVLLVMFTFFAILLHTYNCCNCNMQMYVFRHYLMTHLYLCSKVRFLSEYCGNIMLMSHFYDTALHFAAMRGHEKIVDELLSIGVSRDAKDKNGRSVLHLAAKAGRLSGCNFYKWHQF